MRFQFCNPIVVNENEKEDNLKMDDSDLVVWTSFAPHPFLRGCLLIRIYPLLDETNHLFHCYCDCHFFWIGNFSKVAKSADTAIEVDDLS